MEKVVLQLPEDSKDHVIRFGEAPSIKTKKVYSVSGRITAPFDYFEHHKENIKTDQAVFHVDNSDELPKVILFIDRNNHESDIISGSLELSEHMKFFNFKSKTKYTADQLYEKLRPAKKLFKSIDEYDLLMNAIKNLKISVKNSVDRKQESNTKRETNIVEEGSHNLPESIEFNIQIFKGYEKVNLTFEIFDEMSNGNIVFMLENFELDEIISEQAEKIVSELREEYKTKDYLFISI